MHRAVPAAPVERVVVETVVEVVEKTVEVPKIIEVDLSIPSRLARDCGKALHVGQQAFKIRV